MFAFIRSHTLTVAAAAAVALGGLAWVAFGFFGVHTLFVDDVVDEAGPVFDAPSVAAEPASAEPRADGSDEAATAPSTPVPVESPPIETAEPVVPIEPVEPVEPEIVTEFAGTFVDAAHPTAGTASVLGNGTGQRFVRFVDFETDNGPDLNVYLRDPDTGEFVDLGDLKGNVGDQNYEIPSDVDLDRFSVVEIWCVRFGVGFGSAELTAA